MKHLKHLFTVLLLLCSVTVNAHDFEVDGIYYKITRSTDKTVEVTYSGRFYYTVENEYTGDVVIPESVVYNGISYSVTSIGERALYDCSGLTSIEIPNSVTSIGNYAFYDCTGLTSIEIPNSVTSIGERAFYRCSGLTSVTIPNSVTSIGEWAFNRCSSLTSVTISNSVTSIGNYAFYGCSGLTSIEIPNSVTSIGEGVFYECSGLTSVTIPNSVTSIGSAAFNSCTGLTSVTIPNSVTSIGGGAFYRCSGLTSVTIPNSVTSIGESVFFGCSGLTSVTIPNSVTSIGWRAFYGCSGLTSIEIPNSVTSIGSAAFEGCSSLTAVYISDLSVWCNMDFASSVSNPLSNGGNLYLNGELLTELVIPDDITTVSQYAFYGCSSLTSIEIPNTVTDIGSVTFAYCSNLESITVASDNPKYDSRNNCNAIIHVWSGVVYLDLGCKNTVIPNSVTSIGHYAFEGCTGLTSIEIPNSVTSIGSAAFRGCSGLTSIEIPNSVISIENNVFYGCSGLTNVTIPNSVTSIGYSAFEDCTGLTSIEIPNGVTSIGEWAFKGCTGLANIGIPNSVISIGDRAFEGTIWYDNLPDGVVYVGNVLYKYKGTMPANTSIIVKEGTSQICGTAFYDCSGLVSVTIPKTVESLGEQAFAQCPNLAEVTVESAVSPDICNSTFDESDKKVLNIPEGCTASYLEWMNYFQIPNCQYICDEFTGNDGEYNKLEWYYCDGDVIVYGSGEIDGYPFSDLPVKTITFAGDFTSISNCGNANLKYVYLPKTLKTLGENAFSESALDFVVLPGNIEYISGSAFGNYYGCDYSPVVVCLNYSAPYIGEEVFRYTSLYIPEGAIGYNGCDGTFNTGYIRPMEYVDGNMVGPKVYVFGDCDFSWLSRPEEVESVIIDADASVSGSGKLINLKQLEVNSRFPMQNKLFSFEGTNAVLLAQERSNSAVAGLAATLVCGTAKTVIPENVVSIRSNAFAGAIGLEEIVIPLRVRQLESGVFNECSNLRKVVVESLQFSASSGIFGGCSIDSLLIGKGVAAFDNNVFKNCNSLANITVDPENSVYDSRNNCNAIVKTASDKLILASMNCVIPESVTAVSGYAYCAAADIDVTVPASVTSIDNGAFSGVNRLYFESEIPATIDGNIFGNGAVYVPSAAYETYCNADVWRDYVEQIVTPELAEVCIESESVEGVSGVFNAFDDSRLIRKIVKLKVTGNINSYDIILFRDKMPYLNELDLSEATVIASSKPFYQTYCTGNNSLGGYAFYDLDKLISVKLPKNLKVLDNNAFQGCNNLLSVDASATAELNIGTYAFDNCSKLKSFVSPAKISEVGSYAFNNCDRLEKIELNDISGSIGENSFANCNNLSKVDLEHIGGNICENAFNGSLIRNLNIDYIGGNIQGKAFYGSLVEDVRIAAMDGNLEDDAFRNCQSLKNVEFGRGPIRIGSKVFAESDSLVSFIAGDGTLEVAAHAFYACVMIPVYTPWGTKWEETAITRPALKRVVLPNSVQSIGNGAFYNCTSLDDFTMPKNITSIAENAFYLCHSLQSINLPAALTEVPKNAFHGCSSLTDITFPEKLKVIGEQAFYGCGFDDLRLPPKLNTISKSAFQGCRNLTELHIPSSVEYIGSYAFSGCSQLNDIYTYTVEPTTITETTFSTFGSARLYIPETSFQYYYWDIGWSRFNEDRYQKFSEVYDYFYLNNDYVLNESTGYIEGTPDADMYPGSGLIVEGEENGEEPKQNLGDVSLESDGEGNSASIIGDQNLYIENLNVKINVKGGRWYFFAFPWDVKLNRISMQNGSDYVFRYYDGEERAKKGNGGWKNVNESLLKAARGYIFQSSGDDVLVISIEDVKFKKEDKYNELIAHTSENLNDASWNLMGNPYLSYYDMADMDYTAPVTVWDGEKYVAIRPGDDDYQFAPYEAFFVQKPEGEENVTFAADGQMTKTQAETDKLQKADARRVRGIDPQRLLVNLVLTDDVTEDRTRVVFNERQTHNYETACDAAKFETAGIPQLYTMDNEGIRYAINERPKGNGVVLMGYTAPTPGYYTIDAPRMDTQVFLYDAETGEIHYFEDGAYRFSSEAGTFEKRFSLGIRDDETTGIEEITENELAAVVAAVDGGIRVDANVSATIYNAASIMVAVQNGAGVVQLPAGTYIVCVGENNTKVVVK